MDQPSPPPPNNTVLTNILIITAGITAIGPEASIKLNNFKLVVQWLLEVIHTVHVYCYCHRLCGVKLEVAT